MEWDAAELTCDGGCCWDGEVGFLSSRVVLVSDEMVSAADEV